MNAAETYLGLEDAALVAQCLVDHYRDRGPGGTKHNKSMSAVRLRHKPTGVVVTASEQRSQHVNKAKAVKRLREAIALSVRSPLDIEGYAPGELLASCITRGGHPASWLCQLSVGLNNPRYNAALSEVLDVLAACNLRVSDAAKLLGISTGNLGKFIRRNTKVFARVNEMRAKAGLRRLS